MFFFFVVMNTSLGPNFPTMVVEFNYQIPKTLNLDFMFFFFKDGCKALSTHANRGIGIFCAFFSCAWVKELKLW
jgi:hypothetical protein